MPTILFFGYHNPKSARSYNLENHFRKEGYEVKHIVTDKKGFWPKYRDLARKYKAEKQNADAVCVMFLGHYLMPLAWWLTRFPRKKLIFDAFISLYDTNVCDRKFIPKWHPKAWFLYFVDTVSCHLADLVLIDTKTHQKFFQKAFFLPEKRIQTIYLEAHAEFFHPKKTPRSPDTFEVFFYGTYIPLQGIEYIIRAAKILESKPDIHFTLVGSGQTYPEMRRLAEELDCKNITFEEWVQFEELPDRIRGADVCLGIFGTSNKAQRVIPHKVYDAIACGQLVITQRSPGIAEKFTDGKEVVLCNAGDSEDLAEKIVKVYKMNCHGEEGVNGA